MAVEYIGNGGPDGTSLGSSATEVISLHNATPCAQAAHIADATDATTALTRINAILVVIENKGLTALA